MATPPKSAPQDLPPKGGYPAISFKRVPTKVIFPVKLLMGVFLVGHIGGFYRFSQKFKAFQKQKIEMRSARFALYPLLLAERDRILLKHMQNMREKEVEVMKDVQGWEVGTWRGSPIYETVPSDTFIEPDDTEAFLFCEPNEAGTIADLRLIV